MRLHSWSQQGEAAVGVDLIDGVFGGKWHNLFDITDESGGQRQHARSTQAQFWLAGLCPEQGLTHGWDGIGSHSALVQVSDCGKQPLEILPCTVAAEALR